MKLYYPAVFSKDESGFSITFPDIPEAITQGDSFENAISMAKECLGLCLDTRIKNKEELPNYSESSKIKLEKDEFFIMIEYDSLEFEKKYNCHAIRKNVTIPAWLNKIAEEENINFSNVLQNALIEKLKL